MSSTKPSKEQLQAYLQQRHESKLPPPSPAEIRRQLGWGLVQSTVEVPR